jgi:hypothetical protein
MFSSKCKNCGGPKKGHATIYTGDALVLHNMCQSSGKPDMNKFNALIKAGAPVRTAVRTKDVGVT